jgi:hypothetical protein
VAGGLGVHLKERATVSQASSVVAPWLNTGEFAKHTKDALYTAQKTLKLSRNYVFPMMNSLGKRFQTTSTSPCVILGSVCCQLLPAPAATQPLYDSNHWAETAK